MANDVEMANDDGADPTSDIEKQNAPEKSGADAIDQDDPRKAEKLSKLGGGDDQASAGTE